MNLEYAQEKFINLMRDVKSDKDKTKFLKWIYSNWSLDKLIDDDDEEPFRNILSAIAEDLRCKVPLDAILPSENIKLPVCGPNSDCNLETTMHIDEFLYDEDNLNELVDKEVISRHYCGKCYSKDIKFMTLISHSMSISRINYIFKQLLPPLKDEIVLDIGSRLGPVLYGAYLYTSSPKIIGVEINPDFCKLQLDVIHKYKFGNRIQIICNNIFNEIEVLSTSDVIILNNVFEFFADPSTSACSWQLLAQHIKPGSTLVTVPHLEDTFAHIKVEFDWNEWVEELEPYINDNDWIDEDTESNVKNVKHYKVKKRFDDFTKSRANKKI